MDDKVEANELVISRLKKERKEWRQDHPFGFSAKPTTNTDGSINMFKWECIVPGPNGTIWEGGAYHLYIDFTNDYPVRYLSLKEASQVCLQAPYPSSQCLPFWNCLSVHIERRGRLETSYHCEDHPVGHPEAFEGRAQHREPCSAITSEHV